MSTRGRIGIVRKDGTVASIYQHWDSYPTWLGKMLLKNYKSKRKIEKLIALGDCSCVREEVDIPEGKTHTFDEPLLNVTIAYGRDRGETGIEARIDKNIEAFVCGDVDEWGYLFKDKAWYVVDGHKEKDKRHLVKLLKSKLYRIEISAFS